MSWAALIRALGPTVARMMGGAETSAAARGAAAGGARGAMRGVKPINSPWPSMMHAGNQDTASRIKQVEDEREAAATAANESLKELAKGFAKTGPLVLLLGEGFKKTVKLVTEYNRNFAQYNGKTAASFAQLDVDRIRRDIRFANATQGSSTGLNKSLSRLEEAFLPLEAAMADLLNRGLIVLADVGEKVVNGATLAAMALDKYVEWQSGHLVDPVNDQVWKDIAKKQAMQGTAGGLGLFLNSFRGGAVNPAEMEAAMFRGRVQQDGSRRANEFRDRVNSSSRAGYAAGVAAYEAAKANRSAAAHRLNRGLKPGDAPPLD